MALLQTKQLIKIYRSGYEGIKALGGIDLSFERNEFVAILGPSGCGKSTFLNVISGLEIPSSGTLYIQGQNTAAFNKDSWDILRRHNIGIIFQHFNLIDHYTALENVLLAFSISGMKRSYAIIKAEQLLDKVGLHGKYHNTPGELSGGEKQRVAIARALANDPDIILADEPTGSLDSKTAIEIMDLLQSIAKDKLLIMVTHNHEFATKYATRIIHMEDGLIVSDEVIKTVEPSPKTRLKFSKKGLSYKDGISLVRKSIKNHFGRFFATILASSIGIAGVALIIGLGEGTNRLADQEINKYLNANIVPVFYTQKTVSGNLLYSQPSDDKLNQLVKEIGSEKLTYHDDYREILDHTIDFRLSYPVTVNNTAYFTPSNISLISDSNNLQHFTTSFVPGSRFAEENTIQEIVVNTSILDELNRKLLKQLDYETYLNQEFHLSFQFQQRDKYGNPLYDFTFDETLKIVGIVYETSFFSNPSIYMYRTSFENHLSTLSNGKTDRLGDATCDESFCISTTVLEILDTENILNTLQKINNNPLFDTRKDSYLMLNDITIFIKNIIGSAIGLAQIVLMLFVITAMVVSMFMIAILLYTSVIEKRLEIGILKSLGATNQDVKRYVLSESMLVGFFTALTGIVVALVVELFIYLFSTTILGTTSPFMIINIPIVRGITYSNITLIRYLPFFVPILLFAISLLVSFVSGLIPAHKATKLTIVDVLREE